MADSKAPSGWAIALVALILFLVPTVFCVGIWYSATSNTGTPTTQAERTPGGRH